jgi:hypothetical protein
MNSTQQVNAIQTRALYSLLMDEDIEKSRCNTCYGTGELVTEQGAAVCPDCFGDGHPLGHGAKLEWRLREIERRQRGSGRDDEADVLWMAQELRRCREALVHILALCQDADENNTLAVDVKYRANEALGLYDKSQ